MKQDLRDSHELLDQTGRLAKVGGWQLDVDTQTLHWTAEVYRIHEVDPACKLTIAEAIQFYAPEARPVITAAVQAAIDAGTPFDLELPLMTARSRHIRVRALGSAAPARQFVSMARFRTSPTARGRTSCSASKAPR